MTLSPRQLKLLNAVIREYTRRAVPVGSDRLASLFRVSPATIRIELGELEDEGYLTHPHTSAGRIPTEEGYRFYLDHFVSDEAWRPDTAFLREIEVLRRDFEACARWIAKTLAEETGETVFVGLGPDRVFYTGLTNLVSKPEFQDHEHIIRFSAVLDELDDIMRPMFGGVPGGIRVYVGSENPFGPECGSILAEVRLAPRIDGLVGIIGPMRMDYERNIAIMRGVRELFSTFAG